MRNIGKGVLREDAGLRSWARRSGMSWRGIPLPLPPLQSNAGWRKDSGPFIQSKTFREEAKNDYLELQVIFWQHLNFPRFSSLSQSFKNIHAR